MDYICIFLVCHSEMLQRALKWFVKINHVSIWKGIQKYKPKKIFAKKNRKIDEYIIDETLIKIGSELIWLWVAIEPKDKEILSITYQKRGICL